MNVILLSNLKIVLPLDMSFTVLSTPLKVSVPIVTLLSCVVVVPSTLMVPNCEKASVSRSSLTKYFPEFSGISSNTAVWSALMVNTPLASVVPFPTSSPAALSMVYSVPGCINRSLPSSLSTWNLKSGLPRMPVFPSSSTVSSLVTDMLFCLRSGKLKFILHTLEPEPLSM